MLQYQAKVTRFEISSTITKAEDVFHDLEPHLLALVQNKARLSEIEQSDLEGFNKNYIKLRQAIEEVKKTIQNEHSSATAFELRGIIEELKALVYRSQEILHDARTVTNEALSKEIPQEPEPIAVVEDTPTNYPRPSPPKNADDVDRMIYDFVEKKASGLRFEKVSPNNYIFGTKKIYAKITNGVLLVRVGGGFMDIESFYKQYGDQEFQKQLRQENKVEGERISVDTLLTVKNIATKLKNNKKVKAFARKGSTSGQTT